MNGSSRILHRFFALMYDGKGAILTQIRGISTSTNAVSMNNISYKMEEVTDYAHLVNELRPHLPHSMKLHQSARLTQLGKYPNQLFYKIVLENEPQPSSSTVYLWTRRRNDLTAISLFSPEGSPVEVIEPVLDDLAVVDWSQRIIFSGIRAPHFPLVKRIAEKHGKIRRVAHTELMACPIRTALELNISTHPEAYLAPLRPEDARLLTNTWKFADPETHKYILDIIQEGLTTGLYLKDDGSLVSWAVVQPFGGIGMFETLPSHQGLGYGTLTLGFTMRMVADMGMIPYLYVEKDNDANKDLISKMGFRLVGPTHWIYYLPHSMD